MKKRFKERGIPYKIQYVEEPPELVERYQLKRSPNIIVDGEPVYRGMPNLSELQRYLDELKLRIRKHQLQSEDI